MANNYSQWSEIIQDLSDEEIKFFNECFFWEPAYNEDHELPEDFEWPAWYDEDAEGVHFEYSLNKKERYLHVYAEEYGNLDTLAALMKEFIDRFRPNFVFTVTWADTCSKMRAGEFGGGGMIVSRFGSEWMSAYDWVSKKREELQKKMEDAESGNS
jgi:hypothetical protein